MKRFSKLEFGSKSHSRQGKAGQGEPIRDAEYFYNEAMRYWLGGDYELALRNFSRSLEQNNSFYQSWHGQVLMLIELGEYNEANVWADKALELFPEHPELLAAKALACVRDGRMEKALAYSDNSVSKENATARVWLARAEILLNRKSGIAENCISKAVSLSGNMGPVISLEAGRLLNSKGNYCNALEHLQTAVKGLPKSALAWYSLGYCQAKLGRSEAKTTLQQSLELRPGWDKAKMALTKCSSSGFFGRIFKR